MNDSTLLLNHTLPASEAVASNALVLDAQQAPSALLARLIQEVQSDAQPNPMAYNRTHNRHNRGR